MLRKLIAASAVAGLMVGSVCADSVRPVLTKDLNRPEMHEWEVGTRLTQSKLEVLNPFFMSDSVDVLTLAPQLRKTVAEPLTLSLEIPIVDADSDFSGSESGLGDIELGAELLAFQDVLDYPWIMPHATLIFDTASEDILGEGESSAELGIAVGMKSSDVLRELGHGGGAKPSDLVQWVFDLRYRVFEDRDNYWSIATSFIWEISPTFALIGEASYGEKDEYTGDNVTVVGGGLSYDASNDLTVTLSGGVGEKGQLDSYTSLKVSYDL